MGEVEQTPDALSPEKFISELWGIAPKDWWCEFFTIQYRPTQENPDAKVIQIFFYKVEQVLKDWATIERHLQHINRTEVRNVHPCVNPRARKPRKRGKNADVDAYVAAWADIDFRSDEIAIRESFSRTTKDFVEARLPPSVIIESGHGLHVYWLFDKPYPSAQARPIVAGIQDTYKIADAQSDPSRVLRMPGTVNLKDPKRPELCRIVEATWARYPLEAFSGYAVEPGKSAEDKEEDERKKIAKSLGKSSNEEIERIKKGVGEGQRDVATAAYAGWLFAKGMSLEQAETTLLEWNKLNQPPQSEEEVLKTARSIHRAEKENHPEGRKKRADKGDCEQYFNGKEFLPEMLNRDVCRRHQFISTPIDKSGTGSTIYVYRDGCFRPDGAHTVRKLSHEILDAQAKPGRIDNIVDLVRISQSTDYDTLNPRAKELVNVKNGMLDWKEGKLLPHDPKHLSTYQLKADWDPSAKSELLDKFLSEISTPQDILFIEELIGYLMIPETSLHKSFALVGMPGTGKSTILKLIEHFLGKENVSAIPLQTLEENKYAAASLFGKLANICTELNSSALEDVGLMKAIATGDTIEAEEKYQARFSFRPFCRLVFSANEFPHVVDRKGAFVSRMIFIEFENVFRNTKKEVKKYDEVLASRPETFPAMLNRAVAGLRRVMENGAFTQSEASRRLAVEYTRRCNSVLFFFDENCKVGVEGKWIARRDFYLRYHQWSKDHGLKPVSIHSCLEVIKSIRPAIMETYRDGYPGLKWVDWTNGSAPTTTQSEIEDFGKKRTDLDF